MHEGEMRRCLEQCDVQGIRKLSVHISPHLPQPRTDQEALVALHRARTETNSLAFKLRAYSHRWLLDHGYASGLPDRLKPKAERAYPKVVGAVGIAVGGTSALSLAVKPHIMTAMSNAVLECYADGHEEPHIVKPRMMEAKDYTIKKLIGRL